MIQLIIMDYDGVLLDCKNIHFDALNRALKEVAERYVISYDDHINTYDGLPTNKKLEILTREKGLPLCDHTGIKLKKQSYTIRMLKELEVSYKLYYDLVRLKEDNPQIKMVVASNASRETVLLGLNKLRIRPLFDAIICNEDVQNHKPHSEIYLTAMSMTGVNPDETLIFEDSPKGIEAAKRSGARVCVVKNSAQLTYDFLADAIVGYSKEKISIAKWKDSRLNVLIPAAGMGSRFKEKGYTFPKPLIELPNLGNRPMIQMVVDSLNIEAHYIYLVQREHIEKYNLFSLLNLITPNCNVIPVDGLTQGAACTALLAKGLIDNQKPLFIVNSDQFIKWNNSEFFYQVENRKLHGAILTHTATNPKWSFAKIDETTKLVTQVAEKNPISDMATVGAYYFACGHMFVSAAHQMIAADRRVNGEFYLCPSFQELINDGKRIGVFPVDEFWGTGDPESLEYFINNYKE